MKEKDLHRRSTRLGYTYIFHMYIVHIFAIFDTLVIMRKSHLLAASSRQGLLTRLQGLMGWI